MFIRHSGGFSATAVFVVSLILVCASAWLALEATKKRAVASGNFYLKSQDYTQAVYHFERAYSLSLRPDENTLRGLGESLCLAGSPKKAAVYYEKLLFLCPDSADDRYALAQAYLAAKNYDGAKKQILALRAMNTQKATDYACELTEGAAIGTVENLFKGFFKKIAPGLGGIVLPDLSQEGN